MAVCLLTGMIPKISYNDGKMCDNRRTDSFWAVVSKIEKLPRGIRGETSSKDMASSRNLVSTIGAQAIPTMGDGIRCPEG